MQRVTVLESIVKRDRAIVVGGLLGITALAWGYMFYLAQDMGSMMRMQTWGAGDFTLMFIMWSVMMTGMMLPSAAPMILTFSAFNRRRREGQGPFVPTGVFVLGYVIVWAGFAFVATSAQGGLRSASLLSPMLVSSSPYFGGPLLMLAGVFQFSSIKYACLTKCRTPLGFIMTEWREGTRGALTMGVRHGVYCLGCCWILMALLFVLGVMNLLWIAALAAVVLLEKVMPRGVPVSRLAGVLLILWGALVIGLEAT
ncbi:MAG: DUF2182 domain-containing protein [Chloroflexi bacterium]|nr:DUF2182 domain-containing protein [Chloroflexota bacterium]